LRSRPSDTASRVLVMRASSRYNPTFVPDAAVPTPRPVWGHSSVGRALEWHSRGQGFDSPWLHQSSLPQARSNIAASGSAAGFSIISVRQLKPRGLDPRGAQRPAHRALDLAIGSRATNGRDLQANLSAYDARALIPTERAAFSYQPKDLKSVCRGVRRRFLFDPFLGREAIDLDSTFRDAFRFKLVSLWRKALFLVAPLRHQINGAPSRQVIASAYRAVAAISGFPAWHRTVT
jgi:hypothetical protein